MRILVKIFRQRRDREEFIVVPTDVHARFVEHLRLQSGVVVLVVRWLLQDPFQDHLQLIGQYLERTDRASILRDHVTAVPRAARVLEEIHARRCRSIHRRQ